MAYRLLKSEPDDWPWSQQIAKGREGAEWTGIRNFSAQNHLRVMKKGEPAFFLFLVLVTQMFSPTALVVGLYREFFELRLTGTYAALILSNSAFSLAFAIWVLRAFFASLPWEIEEAAAVDGCDSSGGRHSRAPRRSRGRGRRRARKRRDSRRRSLMSTCMKPAGRVKSSSGPPCGSRFPRVHVQWAVAVGLARFRQPCIRAHQRRGALAGA